MFFVWKEFIQNMLWVVLNFDDIMKDTMSYKLKEYILSKEGEEWLEPCVLAEAPDVYVSNVGKQLVNIRTVSFGSCFRDEHLLGVSFFKCLFTNYN